MIIRKLLFFTTTVGVQLLFITPALAIQSHGDPEGILVHQMVHLFLALSLSLLIYWLRERNLVSQVGWRYIQYAAFFLILWSLDAFTGHLLDEQLDLIRLEPVNSGFVRLQVSKGPSFLGAVYVLAKLDHLFCVPALWFLYRGLKHLLAEGTHQDLWRERS